MNKSGLWPLMLALLTCFPADAHHSNAEYDRGTVTEISGEIIEVIWRNPHVGLAVATLDAEGSAKIWHMEAADLISTIRRGVPAGTFQVGQQVRVAGFASSRRDGYMLVTNVLLPDGVEVMLTRAQPRWSDRYLGGGDWVEAASVGESGEASNIFRVWTLDRTNAPEFTRNPPLTPEAREGHAQWDPFDDPALQCMPLGMPRAITRTGPHPIEFINQGESILLRIEYFDLERTIHMDGGGIPANTPHTALGYSIGRWQDGVLVVETSRVDWPYFDISNLEGVPQSEAVEFTEYFRLEEAGSELHYGISITDSATFTSTVTAEDYAVWKWRPDISIRPYQCELDESA